MDKPTMVHQIKAELAEKDKDIKDLKEEIAGLKAVIDACNICQPSIAEKDKIIEAMAEDLRVQCKCELFCKSYTNRALQYAVCIEQGNSCPTVDEIIQHYEEEVK